jgi:septum formation protein
MKAEAGARRVAMRHVINRPVLGADTTLEVDGEIIGKPASREAAMATLERLSGRSHRVLTAVALSDGKRTEHLTSISEVRFRALSHSEIRQYVATGEPMDKAGAYGIQGRAAIFVADIRGSHSGIMGLPLYETATLLARFGLPVL